MSFLASLRTWYRQSHTPALALQSFTALLGVKATRHEPLSRLLAQLDARQNPAYVAIPGLHHMRWILFTPTEKASADVLDAPGGLILNLTFDGELDDVLEELWRHSRDDMLAVLGHCEGFYDASADRVAYLKRRRVPAGFTFRDIGPFASATASARAADATLLELRSAVQVLNNFADFYSEHPPAQFEGDAKSLMQMFLESPAVPEKQLPLHPLEVRQSEEERWVRLASELMQRKQRRIARRSDDGVVRRAAHAKAHGFLHAKFEICTPRSADESKYHVGLFERIGESFDAVLRPSNASDAVNADANPDPSGLAIGLDLSGISGVWLGRPARQDFLLMDHPVFIVPNVQRLVEVLAVAQMRDRRRQLWHGLRLLSSAGAPRQLSIILRCFLSRPRHPLLRAFHSAVPYQLGRDHIVKYSVEPSSGTKIALPPASSGDDFLSGALEYSLREGIALDFHVHALPVTGHRQLLQSAVEDATLDWGRLGAKRVKLATIEIEGQSDSVGVRSQRAEEWSFSPWNALAEHRPLGSLNRARRVAYREGAAARGAASRPPVPSIPEHRGTSTSSPSNRREFRRP